MNSSSLIRRVVARRNRPVRSAAFPTAVLVLACAIPAGFAGCGGSSSGTAATGTGGSGASSTGGAASVGTGGQGLGNGSGGATTGTGGLSASTGGAPGSTGGVGTGGASATGTGGSVGTGSGGAALGDAGSPDGGPAADAGATGGAGARGGAAGGAAGGRNGGSGGAASDGGVPANLKAVMVVRAAGTPTPGDIVMVARLTARGFKTTFFSDAAVTAAAVAGMDLVVISSSAESGPLGAKLRDVAVPVLCIENGEYPLMGLTPTILNTDYGQLVAQNQVKITAPGNPMIGAATGSVTISSVASDIGWGIPGPAALKGATLATNPAHFAIFGYAKGDQMVGLVAPARRAAFAIRETLAANLTAEGIKLFDAVLDWVLM